MTVAKCRREDSAASSSHALAQDDVPYRRRSARRWRWLMRMTSLVVLSALAAAACVRGAPRVEPVPASSVAQSGGRENARLQGSADANRQSEFDYRRVHSSSGRFITADVLSANGDRSLEEV